MSRRPSFTLQSTAYHEAGHAVAALHFKRRLREVTIVPDADGCLGRCWERAKCPQWVVEEWESASTPGRRAFVEARVMSLLAGGEAEAHFRGRPNPRWAGQDYQHAVMFAERVCDWGEELEAYLGWLMIRTRNFVTGNRIWPRIVGVAQALLRNETLNHQETVEASDNGYFEAFPDQRAFRDQMKGWAANLAAKGLIGSAASRRQK